MEADGRSERGGGLPSLDGFLRHAKLGKRGIPRKRMELFDAPYLSQLMALPSGVTCGQSVRTTFQASQNPTQDLKALLRIADHLSKWIECVNTAASLSGNRRGHFFESQVHFSVYAVTTTAGRAVCMSWELAPSSYCTSLKYKSSGQLLAIRTSRSVRLSICRGQDDETAMAFAFGCGRSDSAASAASVPRVSRITHAENFY